MFKSETRSPVSLLIATALTLVAAAAVWTATPGIGHAEEPRAAIRLKAKPQPPLPAKEVFVRSKPHVSVGTRHPGLSKIKVRPGRPSGPGHLSAPRPELADWYCGEGSGPGGYAECTDDLIASCSGKYVPPKTNGEHQTWGMCHESTG